MAVADEIGGEGVQTHAFADGVPVAAVVESGDARAPAVGGALGHSGRFDRVTVRLAAAARGLGGGFAGTGRHC